MTEHDPVLDVRQLKKAATAADRLVAEIDKLRVDPVENVVKLSGKLDALDKAVAGLPSSDLVRDQLSLFADATRREVESAVHDSHARFGAELEPLLQQIDIRLSGQYPELRAGLFTLELELERGEAKVWLGPKQELLGRTPASPEKVKSFIEERSKNLGSSLDADTFTSRLVEAYKASRSEEQRPVSIPHLLPSLALGVQSPKFSDDPRRDNFRDYGRADLAFDLFRHRQVLQQAGVHLRVATRAETRSRRDFLWVPEDTNGHGSSYSKLEIKEG